MPGHHRQPIRFEAATAAAAVAITLAIAVAGCTSGSDAIPVPGADEEINAPDASFDDAPATAVTDTTQPDEIPTTASPEPVAAEPTPDSAAPTSVAPTPTPSADPSTDDPSETGAETGAENGADAAPTPEAPDDVFLRLGDQGDEVGLMQFKLSALQYLPTGSDTGVFDEATESGLRRFQSDYGLGVDGVFGPVTERSLNAALQSVNVES